MSQIVNVVRTRFVAEGGNVVATTNQMRGGFSRFGQQIQETTRLSERLNNQWRAFGTTMRYAIAGGTIFGLMRMVGQLKEVQQQLGLIAAIGQQAGPGAGINNGLPFTVRQVDQLASGLRNAAVGALTPVQEMNDATVNFLSTVQNVKREEIPGVIMDIGQAAKLSQTPVEDLTRAATTMNVAFGRINNRKNLAEFNRMWFGLISTAPGGIAAAPQIAQQLPTVATMFMMGRGKNVNPKQAQAQMMSLVLGAVRTGAPPSVALRGLTYLLQSIAQPTGGAKKALAGIGITPEFVEKNGVYAALMKLLGQVTNTGNTKLIATAPEDAFAEGDNLPGIPAREMTRLRAMIPRIHGIRAAVILASQLRTKGDVASLAEDLKMMAQEQDNQVKGVLNLSDAWKRFRERSRLQEAAVAVDALRLQVATAFEPVLNLASRGISGVASQARHHQTAAKIAIYGGTAMLAALGVRRFFGGGSLFGGAGNKLVAANAVRAQLQGDPTRGATPANPIYVTVVGTLFGGGGGNNSRPPTTFQKLEDLGTKGVKGWFGWQVLKRMGLRTTGILGRAGGSIAELGPYARFGMALPAAIIAALADPPSAGGQEASRDKRLRNYFKGDDYYGVSARPNAAFGSFQGHAEVWLNLNFRDPSTGKIATTRVHIPLQTWTGKPAPSSRGKSGNNR